MSSPTCSATCRSIPPTREQINRYAAFLHNPANAGLLWGARTVLLAAVILHIIASVQLWNQNRARAAHPLLQEGRRADVVRRAHHDLERPDRRGVRDLPRAAPDGRRGGAAEGTGAEPAGRAVQRDPRLPELRDLRVLHPRHDPAVHAPLPRRCGACSSRWA